MSARSLSKKIGLIGAAALVSFGLAAGPAVAGKSDESFGIEYQGGTADVGGHQTKAVTGTHGYVSLTHNYPKDKKAKFRLASGDNAGKWSELRAAGGNAYMPNSLKKGQEVRMDVKMQSGGKGNTLKGTWRSN